MKLLGSRKTFLVLIPLFLSLIPSAHAEKWVRLIDEPADQPPFVEVDAESIVHGRDGLVYYNSKDDTGTAPTAVDCDKQVYYVVEGDELKWKRKGRPITDRYALAEAEFVCSDDR